MRKSAPSYRWRRRCAAEEPRRAAHSSFLLPAFPGFFSFVAAWPKGRHRIPRLRFSFFHFLNRLSPPHPRLFRPLSTTSGSSSRRDSFFRYNSRLPACILGKTLGNATEHFLEFFVFFASLIYRSE